MPLSSHNCFVLRGRETRINVSAILFVLPSPFMLFSRLLTPALFLPEPPSAYCSPHQTPLKCLRFHFRGWCKRDKSQRHLKSHFPACLCWVVLEGRHSSPDITENILAQVQHPLLLFFPGGLCGCALFCSCCCSFRGFSIPPSPASSPVPWNWGPPHDKNSPCQNRQVWQPVEPACWGKGKIFQCGTLSYKVGDAHSRKRLGKGVCSGKALSLNFDSLMIGIRVSISDLSTEQSYVKEKKPKQNKHEYSLVSLAVILLCNK